MVGTIDNAVPFAVSFELIMEGDTAYWGGEIKAIHLYLNEKHRFTGSDFTEGGPLTLQNIASHQSQAKSLVIKNPALLKSLELRAQIKSLDHKEQPIVLDQPEFQIGKHYQIILKHSMKKGPHGWDGDLLHAIVKEDGACRQAFKPRSSQEQGPKFFENFNARSPKKTLETVVSTFKSFVEKSKNPDERMFFSLVLEKKYEDAICYAIKMKDKLLGGLLIQELVKFYRELNLDISAMNSNPEKQSPLHKAAKAKAWHAYWALAESSANYFTPDNKGKSAFDYYRENYTEEAGKAQDQMYSYKIKEESSELAAKL